MSDLPSTTGSRGPRDDTDTMQSSPPMGSTSAMCSVCMPPARPMASRRSCMCCRISGPLRRSHNQWRADAHHERHQEDAEPLLERELRHVRCPGPSPPTLSHDANTRHRKVNEESVLAVQIFDQKKFKKKDQGFLGVINVRIGSVIDLDAGGDGRPDPCRSCTIC